MSKILTEQRKIAVIRTDTFLVTTPSIPHIDKFDGGHLILTPLPEVSDRCELADPQAMEIMKLSGICGLALKTILNKQGILVERVNYQDNGNWSYLLGKEPKMHIHIYGRAKNSIKQTWGQGTYFPDPHSVFYDSNRPLTVTDIIEIKEFILSRYPN